MSKIKHIRKEHSLSTLFIANMVDVSEDHYIQLENEGYDAFTKEQLKHLTIVFGVNHSDLLDTPIQSKDQRGINQLKNYRKILNERNQ